MSGIEEGEREEREREREREGEEEEVVRREEMRFNSGGGRSGGSDVRRKKNDGDKHSKQLNPLAEKNT